MSEQIQGFGTTNYSDSKFQTWKLPKADGSLLLRPLPPMKSMIGRPGVGLYWKTHFGWSGRDSQDPTKTRFRPFLCLEEKRDGMIVQKCPACELRKKRQDKIAAIKIKGKEKGKSFDEIKAACAPHEKWLRDHGLDGKVRIPCVNKQGQVGIFLAPYGVFKDFRDKCRQLNQKGHDPAGMKGVFFEFIRTGQASPTSDSCEPHRISMEKDGETVERLDFHTLTQEIASAALENIPDLNEMMEKSRYSLEKIEALCALSERTGGGYDPDEVDAILGVEKRKAAPAKKEEKAKASSDDDWASDDDEAPAAAAPKSSAKASTPVDDDDFGDSEPEAKAAPPKTASKPAASTAKAPPKSDDGDEELDDVFGS